MANIFIISDTHFGHANVLKFTLEDGSLMRPGFRDVDHMNEVIIERWNSVVRPQDKVYHLGDIAMNEKYIQLIQRCNGHKRLVLGNHDPKHPRIYTPFFEAVYSMRVIDNLMFTHVPAHPQSIRGDANVHGHVHNNLVAKTLGPKYFNACVEVIDYTPVSFEDVKRRVKKQLESLEPYVHLSRERHR